MKIAISVEDSLMEKADHAACDLGLTRSGLIAQALREFLSSQHVTKKLNEVYALEPDADERKLVQKFRTKLLVPGRW